jgi:uncharacterized protein (TIGR03084 family)
VAAGVPIVTELCVDLAAEHDSLDSVVAGQPDESWLLPTPAAGWDVRDTISHLCYFDEAATTAVSDPEAFEAHKADLVAAMVAAAGRGPGADTPDVALGRHATPAPADLLELWRSSRQGYINTATASAARPEQTRVPWYGPPMSLASFTTARIMETWAHGVDIRDAVGAPVEFGPRLRHILHLGVAARPYAYAAHGIDNPSEPVAVEASLPDGATWLWGPDDAPNRLSGPALDLALVFTQRRHHSRTQVHARGPVAQQWLGIAQAFAGAPTVTDPDR